MKSRFSRQPFSEDLSILKNGGMTANFDCEFRLMAILFNKPAQPGDSMGYFDEKQDGKKGKNPDFPLLDLVFADCRRRYRLRSAQCP